MSVNTASAIQSRRVQATASWGATAPAAGLVARLPLDVKRFLTPGVLIPAALALAGITLIVIGQVLNNAPPQSNLPDLTVPPPTVEPTPSETATPGATESPDATATAAPTPLPEDVVAVQVQIANLGINVPVRTWSPPPEQSNEAPFPPDDAVFIFTDATQPGRGSNTFIFGHALEHLFKPLWNARIGDEVLVGMSNEQVLRYRVTEVRPNVPGCPSPDDEPHPYPPLALVRGGDGCAESGFWLGGAPEERVTLQTSQGFNPNWGELIVIAEPVD